MSAHLKPREVDIIIECIRRWPEAKITWATICAEAKLLIGRAPARQTLCANDKIMTAYRAKRDDLRFRSPHISLPSSLAIAAQRVARKDVEIQELRALTNALLERFVRWQYNAYKHGMTEAQLEADLPRIDRGRTDMVLEPKKQRRGR
nr:hypothetical protein [Dyella sp. ASV24]